MRERSVTFDIFIEEISSKMSHRVSELSENGALFSEICTLFIILTFLHCFMETKTGEVRPLKSVKCSDRSLARQRK